MKIFLLVASLLVIATKCTMTASDNYVQTQIWQFCVINMTLLDIRGLDYNVDSLCVSGGNQVYVILRCASGSSYGAQASTNLCLHPFPLVPLQCNATMEDQDSKVSMLLALQGEQVVVDSAQYSLPPSQDDVSEHRLVGNLRATRFTFTAAQQCVTKEEDPKSSSPLSPPKVTSQLTVSQKTLPSHKSPATALVKQLYRRETQSKDLSRETYKFSPTTEEPNHNLMDMKMKDEPADEGGVVTGISRHENLLKNRVFEGVGVEYAAGNSYPLIANLIESERSEPVFLEGVLNAEKGTKNSKAYTDGTDNNKSVLPGEQVTWVESGLQQLSDIGTAGVSTSMPYTVLLQASTTAPGLTFTSTGTDDMLENKRLRAVSLPSTPSSTTSSSRKMSGDNVMGSDVVDNFDEDDNLVVRSRELTKPPLPKENEDTFESDVTDPSNSVNLMSSPLDKDANESTAVNTENTTINSGKINGNSDIPNSPANITPTAQGTIALTHVQSTKSTGTTIRTSTMPKSTTTVSTSTTSISTSTKVSTSTAPKSTTMVSSSRTSTSETTTSTVSSRTTESTMTVDISKSSSVNSITVPQNTDSTNPQQIAHSIDSSNTQTPKPATSSDFSTQTSDYISSQTNKSTASSEPNYSTVPITDTALPTTSKATPSETTIEVTSTKPPSVFSSITLEVATKSNSSGLAINTDSGSSEDDTFWPIVAALVIGIPSIIVFGIAIVVIHRRRRVISPRLRTASMYPSL